MKALSHPIFLSNYIFIISFEEFVLKLFDVGNERKTILKISSIHSVIKEICIECQIYVVITLEAMTTVVNKVDNSNYENKSDYIDRK